MLSRTLPWERDETSRFEGLLTQIAERNGDTGLIKRAYKWASRAHQGQYRKSGEPYLSHPLSVARILASYELDETTLAAALLHDVVEDTGTSLEDIKIEFGEEVSTIVDGLTKLDKVSFVSEKEAEAASMRKMIVAVAQDIRVLFIKLADRLHNMRTLGVFSKTKRERIANETLRIYAPLAHRLGMMEMASQLEDLAFSTLHAKWYAEVAHMVEARAPERELFLTQVSTQVEDALLKSGITAEVLGRPKHLWSIYKKILKGQDFNDIYDLSGLRVLVGTVSECYEALGYIHSMWKMLPGRLKDHIAIPKFNLYQSIHTTVIGPGGNLVEIQIRTKEMDERAERGVSAHWAYKEAGESDLAWLSRIMDWTEDTAEPLEMIDNLHSELEQDEVFVFTPKGDLITLPKGATPIDFAYAIHTEVGNSCQGASVNGQMVSLSQKLNSGEVVEILSSPGKDADITGPDLNWLGFAVSHRARNRIQQWYAKEKRADTEAQGKEALAAALEESGLTNLLDDLEALSRSPELEEVAGLLNYADASALFAAIGEGYLSPKTVLSRLSESDPKSKNNQKEFSQVRQQPPAVLVEGQDDIWARLAHCCSPERPDEILGFVTRGKGVSVHRTDCLNAEFLSKADPSRLVQVDWDDKSDRGLVVEVEMRALDRADLIRDVVEEISARQIYIWKLNSHIGGDRVAYLEFELELGDDSQVNLLLKALRRVDSVYDVFLVQP